MRLPKLKYYYLALSSEQYQEFESSRTLTVSDSVSINIETGQIQGRTLWIVTARGTLADDVWRGLGNTGACYVLRVPADHIDRAFLTRTPTDNVFEYRHSLRIPHCGVERFETVQRDLTVAVI